MNMGGFLFSSFLPLKVRVACASPKASESSWWSNSSPKNLNRNQLLWGRSHPHSQQENATQPFPALLPTGVPGDSICTQLLRGPASTQEERDHNEKSPLARQAKERPGRHPTSWFFTTSNQAKLYKNKSRESSGLHLSSSFGLCPLMYCTRRTATEMVSGPSSIQNQAQDPVPSTSLSKDVRPLLTSSPSLVTKQNKRHPAGMGGRMHGWFGIWGFFGFAFKWEEIIGGKKKKKLLRRISDIWDTSVEEMN